MPEKCHNSHFVQNVGFYFVSLCTVFFCYDTWKTKKKFTWEEACKNWNFFVYTQNQLEQITLFHTYLKGFQSVKSNRQVNSYSFGWCICVCNGFVCLLGFWSKRYWFLKKMQYDYFFFNFNTGKSCAPFCILQVSALATVYFLRS